MESSEVNRSTAAKSKVEQHVEKSAPPPPPAPPPNNAAGDYYDDDDECSVSSSSSAASSPSNRSSTRKPPESQEMEGYRIPASVFERNKSSTPGDWSVASNESLFSIHVGNMSFTNDQYTWHSEELTPSPASAPAAVPSTSDHMFSYSSGGGGAADMRSHELGIAEATMLEVIKENEARPRPPFMPPEARQARRSAGSNQSNMSFAFSVAGGEAERLPSSVKSGIATGQSGNPESQEEDKSPVAKDEKEAPPRSKWLSYCCPCYSFCS